MGWIGQNNGLEKIIIYEPKSYFIINPNSRSKYVSKK